MIGFVNVLGSDTGLLKLSDTYILIMPIIFCKLTAILTNESKFNLNLFLVIVTTLSIFAKLESPVISYQDKPIKQLTSGADHNKLRWIKTSKTRTDHIKSIISIVNGLRRYNPRANFIFYGSKAYLFTYLTNSKILFPTPFYMDFDNKDNEQGFSNYLSKNNEKPYVFLIFDYPDRPVDMNGGLITKCLINYGYNRIFEGLNYQVYAASNK